MTLARAAQVNRGDIDFQYANSGVNECLSDCDLPYLTQNSISPRQLNADSRAESRLGTFTSFFGVDGSKQPQDFGANANFGAAAKLNYSGPLFRDQGIGFQVGSRVTFSGNAVQVYELVGEAKDRFQNFTTVGLFQRFDSGFGYGFAYDHLSQESFDNFTLAQWRFRASFELTPVNEIGVTVNFSDRNDTGRFNAESIVLDPVEQLHIYLRRDWQSGVNTSFWLGIADKHSEENVLTGTLPPKDNQLLFGAEIFAPLNDWMAIYGETNLIMPADTGAVDAYLGIQIAPQGIRRSKSRQNRFRSFLPVASNPTFTVDLNRQ
ncbi:MAG: DUF6666 family protein [Mariniblastus sp.]